MAKKDRTDNRKIREQRKQFKVPELCCQAYTKCNVDAEILLNSLYWFEYQKQQMA